MNRRDLLKAAIGIPLAAKAAPAIWATYKLKTRRLKRLDPWALIEIFDFESEGFTPAKRPELLLQTMRELR